MLKLFTQSRRNLVRTIQWDKETTFEQRLNQICAQHSRRAALMRRLRDAGLYPS